jgi:choice-of-anchor B domain-containing protein
MPSRFLRLTLLTTVLALCAAAPASASHPPTHEQKRALTFEEALVGFDASAALRQVPTFSAECENGMAGPYPCENVDLLGFVPLPMLGGATGNDVWGWTDPENGNEYAIMGTSHSAAFVNVTDPKAPHLVGYLPTAGIPDFVLWRTVRIDGHHAFIASEITDHGVQVFDLHRLREVDPSGPPEIFDEDATYFGTEEDPLSNTHAMWIDEPNDTMYLTGTNTCGTEDSDAGSGEDGGLHMVDISDPLNPTFAGCALLDSFIGEENNNYVHETWCETYHGPDTEHQGKEICFASNENVVAIFDVTNKANPVLLSETTYPDASYTHQGSPSLDHRWFMFNDELDEQEQGVPTTTYILNISDLDNPPTPTGWVHPGSGDEPQSATIDHNAFVHGNRQFQSNYSQGLEIMEFSDASLAQSKLERIAYFDVLPGVDVAEFAGTWSNFRFPSGNVVLSLIEEQTNGLMMVRPNLPEPTAAAADTPKPKGAKKPKKKCKKGAKRKGKKGKCKKRKRKKR